MLFGLALASAWWRGLDINCGCFGNLTPTAVRFAFARSAALGLAAGYLIKRKRSNPDRQQTRT